MGAPPCSDVRRKTSREVRQTKILFAFSQEAAYKVQPNDRMHERFGSTPVEETLRVFVAWKVVLKVPKMIDGETLGIHPRCRGLARFSRFERFLEKSQRLTGCARFGSTYVLGTLRAFLRLARCQENPKCSGVAQCTIFVYVLGTLLYF